MDFDRLYTAIIPPMDYEHRYGFSNQNMIDSLSANDLKAIEIRLIEELADGSTDTLIVKTLSYIESLESLPYLYSLINASDFNDIKMIILMVSIYLINKDSQMIDLAIERFSRIEADMLKTSDYMWARFDTATAYLSLFRDSRINNIIAKYQDHHDLSIRISAKAALNNRALNILSPI